MVAVNLRRSRPRASARWHLDEMVIKIRGRQHWLWRAVDDEGEVLDFLVQPRRCARSARSPFESSGFLRSMIRACGPTIELQIHTSRFGGENENSSGSNRLDPPNVSSRSTPPSRTPSTSNVIFCHAASSRYFVPRRLLSGSRAASQPDPWSEPLRPTAPVNVSMPYARLFSAPRPMTALAWTRS